MSLQFLKLQRKIGDNLLFTKCFKGYFQEIQKERLTFVIAQLISFTVRTYYIKDHLRAYYYDVWERKNQFNLCKKHTQECVDHINPD